MLSRVNQDVLVDIDDFIMLQAFNERLAGTGTANKKAIIDKEVELYLETMRDREKMHCIIKKEERDVHAEGKLLDERRKH
jgi:hypothetical protein